jgi:uncharacterized membrane protein YkvA (DUF1232 family)
MTTPQPSPKKDLGFWQSQGENIKLAWRLFWDRRAPFLAKLMPVGSLVYFFWPVDIPGPIDDIALLWVCMELFIQSCPPWLVSEHRQLIEAERKGHVINLNDAQPSGTDIADDPDVVEGEFREWNQK